MCTFFRPSCVQKTSLTNESDVSSPSDRGISAYVRVVVLGVLRRAVCWDGKKSALSVAAPALQASGRHRTTLVRDAHCLGSARWWVSRVWVSRAGKESRSIERSLLASETDV